MAAFEELSVHSTSILQGPAMVSAQPQQQMAHPAGQGSGGAAWCNPYLSDCRAVFDLSASTSARPKPAPMSSLLNRLESEVEKARNGVGDMNFPPQRASQRGAMMRVGALIMAKFYHTPKQDPIMAGHQ